MRRSWLIGAAILFLAPIESRAGAPLWKAGAAKVIITPERFMWMSGYGARAKPAEGKATELYAKALYLEDGAGQGAVVVTLDLVGIDRDMAGKIARGLEAKQGLPRDRVLLSVSHTHCGPVVGGNLNAMYFLDDAQQKLVAEYAEKLPSLVFEVVAQAKKKLAPARLESGRGHAGFAVNRRNNKEPEVAKLRQLGKLQGPNDHDVPVLSVRDAEGVLQAVLFGYACHATTMDFLQWCGDWPGYAQAEIEAAHPGSIALFYAGCGADQNPLPRRSLALAQAYGKELAQAVEAVVKAPMSPVRPALKAKFTEIDLPFGDLPSREKLADDMLSKDKFIASRAKLLMNEMLAKGALKSTYPYPVQAWQLGGDLTWIALGGEVVVDYSLRLKKELGDLWVIGYANDVMAYIPSRRVLKEGGYEGATSMVYYGQPTVWSPRVEDMIVETATHLVRAVRMAK
jgi:neutral ceramidase